MSLCTREDLQLSRLSLATDCVLHLSPVENVCINTSACSVGVSFAYDPLNKGSRSSYAVNITLHLIGAHILQDTVWLLKMADLVFEKHLSKMSSVSSLFIKSSCSFSEYVLQNTVYPIMHNIWLNSESL